MESWSDLPVREEFVVKIYLDTNILAYLIDASFAGLSDAFHHLQKTSFVTFSSSRFAIFEFIGIRKREHFLRQVLAADDPKNKKTPTVNLSSLLKYKDDYSSERVNYLEVQPKIKKTVEREVERIRQRFNVDVESNSLHDGVWKPTFDLHLASKISKEDCLISISAVSPDSLKREVGLVILTNDAPYFQWHDDEKKPELEKKRISRAYSKHGLSKPPILFIRNLGTEESTVNLTKKDDIPRVKSVVILKLIELIKANNSTIYLGLTISCDAGAATRSNLICFRLETGKELKKDLYLSIIGKDLDFIYNTKICISDFWNHGKIEVYPHVPTTDQEREISFKLTTKDENGAPKNLDQDILNRLRESGNLIFIHPDSA